MFDALYLTFCAVAWGIAGYKARAWLRDPGNTDLGLLSLMTTGIATLFLFSAPSVYRWFDRLTGVANLAIAVIYTAVVVFAAGAWVLFLRWIARASGEPDGARTRTRIRLVVHTIGAVWAVAVVAFALGRPDAVEHPRDFSTAYTSEPGVVIFLVLYLAIFVVSLVALKGLCRKFAATLGGSWLARGLKVVAAGCRLGLLYPVCKLAGLTGAWAGADMNTVSNGIAPISGSLAALLVIGGFALPAAGPRVSAWRRLRRLQPLWRELTSHAPAVTMGSAPFLAWWPLSDLEWRANRQIAEIRDVQRGIRPYVDAAVIDIARGTGRSAALDDDHVAALVEAAALRRGLENRASGRMPAYAAHSAVLTFSTEPAGEHAHLVRVARVYRLPLVDDVLAAVENYQAGRRG